MLQISMLAPPADWSVSDINDGDNPITKVLTFVDQNSPIPIVIPLTQEQADAIGMKLRQDKLKGFGVVHAMPRELRPSSMPPKTAA